MTLERCQRQPSRYLQNGLPPALIAMRLMIYSSTNMVEGSHGLDPRTPIWPVARVAERLESEVMERTRQSFYPLVRSFTALCILVIIFLFMTAR